MLYDSSNQLMTISAYSAHYDDLIKELGLESHFLFATIETSISDTLSASAHDVREFTTEQLLDALWIEDEDSKLFQALFDYAKTIVGDDEDLWNELWNEVHFNFGLLVWDHVIRRSDAWTYADNYDSETALNYVQTNKRYVTYAVN